MEGAWKGMNQLCIVPILHSSAIARQKAEVHTKARVVANKLTFAYEERIISRGRQDFKS